MISGVLSQITNSVLGALAIGLAFGGSLATIVFQVVNRNRSRTFKEDLERQIVGAKKEAENITKAARIDAAEEAIKKKEKFGEEANQIRGELRETELRLAKREDVLERETELVHKQENKLENLEKEIQRRVRNLELQDQKLAAVIAQQKNQLLKMTAMSPEAAKDLLLKRLEEECEHEMASIIKQKLDQATETVDEKSREIITIAIQRFAADQSCSATVSTVEIPHDDMKGRIIGREGRNIRAFEKATGVDVIVDDTPGIIVVSGFHPVRREVARWSMERLIQDGRIHPSRIEEVVSQTTIDVNNKILQIGKDAALETNIRGLSNKILSVLGALNYRTSYGQNVLRHSIEVAFLTQAMADELGLDGAIARRAGLLHDIGKALDHDQEGGHPKIGANFLKKFKENNIVLNAAAAHHGDVPAETPYTPLVTAADAISASRPGARRETLERYVKRLEQLEEIGNGFDGVENTYAIQAGREIRVIVNAEKLGDDAALKTARDIAQKVELEMTYPGEIQITLLRELRCIEYAK
ncbi:MAG: ribonuclease Y [Planctomycetes bacterium]|nr:ribonuclease Y [Planctomycetota bacterium]